jgi:hypothetical protein
VQWERWCEGCQAWQGYTLDYECCECGNILEQARSRRVGVRENTIEWPDDIKFRITCVKLSDPNSRSGEIIVHNLATTQETTYAVKDATKIAPGVYYGVVPLKDMSGE